MEVKVRKNSFFRIIGAGFTILGLCSCCCGILDNFILPESSCDEPSVSAAILATATNMPPTPIPTRSLPTPIPTQSLPTPMSAQSHTFEEYAYNLSVKEIAKDYMTSIDYWWSLLKTANENHLFSNPAWRVEFGIASAQIRAIGNRVFDLVPPSNYEDVQDVLEDIAVEMTTITVLVEESIDEKDEEKGEQAFKRLDTVSQNLNIAIDMVKEHN